MADAEFVFDEDRWVERDLVPIGQGVARLQAKGSLLVSSAKEFERVFNCDAETAREAKFDLLSKHVIGAIEAKRIALVNQSGIDSAGWQHVGID